jgi:2-methylcitrate dehydratase PrpD
MSSTSDLLQYLTPYKFAESISGFAESPLPADVADAALRSTVDWFAACVSGTLDPQALPITDTIHSMRSQGHALAMDGQWGAAAPMALVNAVLAHAVEFDDFHLASVFHASAPTFAAVFALGMDRRCSGADILSSFVAGFEVGVQFGLHGYGLKLAQQGWHPTSILGHLSAAAGCAALLKLNPTQVQYALGHAAVQAGGLMSSAGTMAKAFAIGKAAMGGVMAAELAERGVIGPKHLLSGGRQGLFSTLFQANFDPQLVPIGQTWQITHNTFKPYPSCQLVHASFDAAQAASRRLAGRLVGGVRAFVNPFALTIAKHFNPNTALEARFSLNHSIALGLLGYQAKLEDFMMLRVMDEALIDLRQRVEVFPDDGVERWSARLEITCQDGTLFTETVGAALGSLGRPMIWSDLESKFLSVATPVFGPGAQELLSALRNFDGPDALEKIGSIVSRVPHG